MNLNPIICREYKKLIERYEDIDKLVKCFGSPLNILLPQNIERNINNYQNIFRKNEIKGKIYFAHKANKSKAIVRYLSNQNVNIDVSSLNEMSNVLTNGFSSDKIEVTGPKNKELLYLAIKQKIVINVDSLNELYLICNIVNKISDIYEVKIIVRLCGFKDKKGCDIEEFTRFGIHIKELTKINEILKNHPILKLVGFAFHINEGIDQNRVNGNINILRAIAFEETINIIRFFKSKGQKIEYLDIGGGFNQRFVESKKAWETYLNKIRQVNNNLTWDKSNLGYTDDHPFINCRAAYREKNCHEELNEFLNLKVFDGDKVLEILQKEELTLMVEPGKSLLDQVGITIAEITDVKESSNEEIIICLNMNRSNLCSNDMEMFMDPIIVSQKNEKNIAENIGVYFAGNLCLSTDMIQKHKTFLKMLPQIGDYAIFVNSAGYFMDFSECTSLQQNIAKKIALLYNQNETFEVYMDDKFPYWL